MCYQNCYHPKKTRETSEGKKPLQLNDLQGFFSFLAEWTEIEPSICGGGDQVLQGRRQRQGGWDRLAHWPDNGARAV